MSETLSQKRCRFTLQMAKLILYANEIGYKVAANEVFRTLKEAAQNAADGDGILNSVHTVGLAVDLNLYMDNRYLRSTSDHIQLGHYWESLSDDARWGGRWGDGNHYSLEHNGVK